MLWTLLIFIGCFTPGHDLPHMDVPFIDKWTHLVLFGGFSFLWLCAFPAITTRSLFIMLLIATSMGAVIELLQGWLTFLGRSMELMDAVADSVGAILGIVLFCFCAQVAKGRMSGV